MTTIIAVRKNDGVLIGSDTQTSYGGIYNSAIHSKYVHNANVVIGCAGLGNAKTWVAANMGSFPDVPALAYTSKDAWFTFVASDVMEWLSQFEGFKDCAFVIAIRGQVAVLDGDFQYVEVPSGNVIGTGSGWTKLANYIIVNDVKTKKDVEKALKFASATDNYTSAPFAIEEIKLKGL